MLLLKLSTGIQRVSQTAAKLDSSMLNVVYTRTASGGNGVDLWNQPTIPLFFRYKLLLLEGQKAGALVRATSKLYVPKEWKC